MRNIFLIIGNFGVGKTAVCKYYKHEETSEPVWTTCQGKYMLGGKLGADQCNKHFKKDFVFSTIIPDKADKDIVIHSVFYSSNIDIDRYKKTHNLHVIYLKTSYEKNYERMFSRKGKKLELKVYEQAEKSLEKFMFLCKLEGVPTLTVDNNRDLETVSKEVWKFISKTCFLTD